MRMANEANKHGRKEKNKNAKTALIEKVFFINFCLFLPANFSYSLSHFLFLLAKNKKFISRLNVKYDFTNFTTI
jgi:hypothetical protein